MELTNKRESYSVTNASVTIKLNGEVTISDNDTISSFSGNFQSLEGNGLGGFNYRESNDTVDKHIFSVSTAYKGDAETLLDVTIGEIKSNLEL